MAMFKNIPIKNPHTYSSHFGHGSEHGKPFYHLGQECEKSKVPGYITDPRRPLDLSKTQGWQCRPNRRREEQHLRVFGDPPTHRSCVVTHNKDGLGMDSFTHYSKVGSKHMIDPRPDHPDALYRSISVPSIHPWDKRRSILRDPTPHHFNAAFSTTSDGYGKFYSNHLTTDPTMMRRTNFDWLTTKSKLC
eukprot:TRINITY_DN94617_c0_g1_i1.p1 TRINITY_DN94617_c0_g1~~TRINITY_DN94617_c0_g1_i1.p1  ORF type:complete len:190 (+),score=6.86 TRINITY_DN94617_c0_g1_i1:83-652(+)